MARIVAADASLDIKYKITGGLPRLVKAINTPEQAPTNHDNNRGLGPRYCQPRISDTENPNMINPTQIETFLGSSVSNNQVPIGINSAATTPIDSTNGRSINR